MEEILTLEEICDKRVKELFVKFKKENQEKYDWQIGLMIEDRMNNLNHESVIDEINCDGLNLDWVIKYLRLSAHRFAFYL